MDFLKSLDCLHRCIFPKSEFNLSINPHLSSLGRENSCAKGAIAQELGLHRPAPIFFAFSFLLQNICGREYPIRDFPLALDEKET
jgi:hypothetical protein